MTKPHKPHGFGKFLKNMLDDAKDLADGITDRLSAAECDFRRGLTRLVEPKDHHKPPRAGSSH
ncbi:MULTISPECIES: hypothetical protein [unclassified Streptomyces]|uniref:hypothetical protein n=1 Tax=unclassified Streptomyces TaxID=2593676 RepID=UPI002E77A11E|nr:hypothetical protein [Streptomyces sp. JV176]MEE1801225.1 hypothetical protein [Streptomyces sp. JV176]